MLIIARPRFFWQYFHAVGRPPFLVEVGAPDSQFLPPEDSDEETPIGYQGSRTAKSLEPLDTYLIELLGYAFPPAMNLPMDRTVWFKVSMSVAECKSFQHQALQISDTILHSNSGEFLRNRHPIKMIKVPDMGTVKPVPVKILDKYLRSF